MLELETQLSSIVIAKATFEQLVELVVPLLIWLVSRLLRVRDEAAFRYLPSATVSHGERDSLLLQSGAVLPHRLEESVPNAGERDNMRAMLSEGRRPEYEDTIDDYGEIVIQHGYLVLFGVAFPLAAAINLASNVCEVRTDAYKLLRLHRRADADAARGIGGWADVLRTLSTLSVVTTVGLLTVTTPVLQHAVAASLPERVAEAVNMHPVFCFLVFEHLLLFVRWVVDNLVNEIPGATIRARARREYLTATVFGVGWKPYFNGRRKNKSAAVAGRVWRHAGEASAEDEGGLVGGATPHSS